MPDKTQLQVNYEQMPYFYQRLLEAWLTAESVQEIAMHVGCFTSQILVAFPRAIIHLRASLDDLALLDCLFVDRPHLQR